MNEHPIEGLMVTAMNSIRDMVDVNTIIGEPIEAPGNIVIIPISKVGFGFASGGSEFNGETIDEYKKKDKEEAIQYRLPFGGGSGAGVSITPVAFLVVQSNNVKLLPVNHTSSIYKLLDYVPDLIEKVNRFLNNHLQNKKEEKKEVRQEERRKDKERMEYLENLKEEFGEETKSRTKSKTNKGTNKKASPKTKKNIEIEYDDEDFIFDEDE